MTERECPSAADQPPASEGGGDRLARLTEAIMAYLEEIDDYRWICVRHEGTAAVYTTQAALHIVRLFPWAEAPVASVRKALESLPKWDCSPFWKTQGRKWEELERNRKKRETTESAGALLLTRGIAWGGWPMLVCASSLQEQRILRVELLLLPVQTGLAQLPLRTVASGLRCHEHLVPAWVAGALPPSTAPDARFLSVREYLLRAMPQGLYASQCISPVGAEQ